MNETAISGKKEKEIEDLKRMLTTVFLRLCRLVDPDLAEFLYKVTERECLESPGYREQPTAEAKTDFLSFCMSELISQTILDAVYDYTNFEKVREEFRKVQQ